MTPRDIIELKTTGNKYTETVTDVLEFEDTVFRVRFDGFWIVGASFAYADSVEDGSWRVFGISRVEGGRARFLDLFCRRTDLN